MDIEFHYYITYLIALRAGFPSNAAGVIAFASQQVDDNCTVLTINRGAQDEYSNYISQTSNILKAEKELMQIYPIFHFMPGQRAEVQLPGACRKDGKFHVLNTIPDNSNARTVLDEALKTMDLYRIGIAIHMYADTFAHQNFVGYYESFNAMKGLLDKAIPDVGHADAKHDPDLPGLKWIDQRLVSTNEEISNKERFLKAAGCIFDRLWPCGTPNGTAESAAAAKTALLKELSDAIGPVGDHAANNEERSSRIRRYTAAIKAQGMNGFVDYDEFAWIDEATERKGWFSGIRGLSEYEWKPNYQRSHWYLFQEAVKNHQWFAKDNVLNPITRDLELTRFHD